MAEEIETLTLNDILGPRTVNTPTCQICGESLYTPDLLPVEITNCRHRFHILCLQDWCNNNNRYNNQLNKRIPTILLYSILMYARWMRRIN